jgi:hypothetical protein
MQDTRRNRSVRLLFKQRWVLVICGSFLEKQRGGSMNWGGIIGITCFIAWLTHIFTCFAQSLWGFLLAGAIMFPIGILHGFYLWFA